MNHIQARHLVDRLVRRVAPEIDVSAVGPDAPLQEALGLDSIDFLNIVTALLEETGIDVPARDYPRLGSVNGFVDYLVDARRRADTSDPSTR